MVSYAVVFTVGDSLPQSTETQVSVVTDTINSTIVEKSTLKKPRISLKKASLPSLKSLAQRPHETHKICTSQSISRTSHYPSSANLALADFPTRARTAAVRRVPVQRNPPCPHFRLWATRTAPQPPNL